MIAVELGQSPPPVRPIAVEQDEEVLIQYLEGEMPDAETLKKLIRKGTLNLDMVPVLTGTAFKNKGVQPLLDAVVDYMPSPLDVLAIAGVTEDGEATERKSSDAGTHVRSSF